VIVVAGTIGFETQHGRDAAVEASVSIQRATREQESGCLAYCFASDPVHPTIVQVYELWADQASLAAHFEHPNYFDMRAVLRSFPRAGSSTAKYRCVDSSPVYRPDGTPSADFDAPS
jgi:quinol monooxygenase YgiN